jgi:hypothetical protein
MDFGRALRADADRRQSEALEILSLAFFYDLIASSQSERRHNAGSPYASMVETDGGAYPPRPADLSAEIKMIWAEAADAVDDPVVVSRLRDLLYVAAGKPAYQHGLTGAHAHEQLAAEARWSALDRAEVMARALEVYAELNQREVLLETGEKAVTLVEELLGQQHPGPPLIVARALVALKPDRRPAGLEQLLDQVVEHFIPGDTHAAESALDLAAHATTDPDRKQSLRRRQLELRIAEADAAEGLAQVMFLQRAIELARRFGFTSEAQELLRRQQDLPHEALGFESFETQVDVPQEEVERQVDLMAGNGADDLYVALRRIGGFGPHGGSNADIDAEVEDQHREFPLLGLFGHQLFHAGSSVPAFLANDDEAKRRLARGRRRRLHTEFYGRFLIGPMLLRAVEVHGRPDHDHLAAHFNTELIGEVRGERVARALELFWDHHYDEAAHVIVPRLESILRDIARAEGLLVVKPANEARFGGFVSLNFVLAKLRELNPTNAWLDYLEALLCEPLALNLRNDIAHGLVPRVGGLEAALLVQAGCHLALLRLIDEGDVGQERQ